MPHGGLTAPPSSRQAAGGVGSLCAVSISCSGSSRTSARVGRTRRGRGCSTGLLDSAAATRSRAVSISTNPESGGSSNDTLGKSGLSRGRADSVTALIGALLPSVVASSEEVCTSDWLCSCSREGRGDGGACSALTNAGVGSLLATGSSGTTGVHTDGNVSSSASGVGMSWSCAVSIGSGATGGAIFPAASSGAG